MYSYSKKLTLLNTYLNIDKSIAKFRSTSYTYLRVSSYVHEDYKPRRISCYKDHMRGVYHLQQKVFIQDIINNLK